jgi:hypothetical protein
LVAARNQPFAAEGSAPAPPAAAFQAGCSALDHDNFWNRIHWETKNSNEPSIQFLVGSDVLIVVDLEQAQPPVADASAVQSLFGARFDWLISGRQRLMPRPSACGHERSPAEF